ncbi:GDYXXLXY domain-containing protein [Arcticibacter tournemirensis]|uniref:GDYXXLXY domain-containing protein n=1 Tax=Arcticibacter tournemirensis TaxID=699437 RepID=A0A4Q0MAV5_9SPHI|nr:GDYXXLXY domain-containing protein [Arcticibacter tournemirensis]RXF70408.1 hypothetical protein EKH83_07075 [Arcticibacter tournemirensis]
MKRSSAFIILLNLLLLLIYFNWNVFEKEKTLKQGELVLLELAPVDPRSLMQGDYMRLSYSLVQNVSPHKLSKSGYCVVRLDGHQVAKRVRFQEDKLPLHEGEYLIKYFYNDRFIDLGAGSYFFEEGTQAKYVNAKYGGLRIDNEGNSVLTGLYDKSYNLIK